MDKVLYALVVGSLMYVIVCTRLDIAHLVGVRSWFLSNLGKEYWVVVKWIFMYFCGTFKICLCFKNTKVVLAGYTNVNMTGDVDSRKSTLSYLIIFVGGAAL